MSKPPKEILQNTIPQRYPEVPPQQYPSGDYSYTVELIGGIQNSLGKLTEAVESLKAKTDSHSAKLEAIGKDVHAAKVLIGVASAMMVGIGAFLGYVLKAALEYFSRNPASIK